MLQSPPPKEEHRLCRLHTGRKNCDCSTAGRGALHLIGRSAAAGANANRRHVSMPVVAAIPPRRCFKPLSPQKTRGSGPDAPARQIESATPGAGQCQSLAGHVDGGRESANDEGRCIQNAGTAQGRRRAPF
jgi:hypothetical protein